MDTYVCPKGHASTEPDFCSECGAKIQGVAAATPTGAVTAAAVPASGPACPDCGAPRALDGGSFCEVCGYNFVTGAHGEVPAATEPVVDPVTMQQPQAQPAAPAPLWQATVEIDASLSPEGPAPPAVAPFTVTLDKEVSLIGRRSETRGIIPEIALNFDDGVSHRHALLQRASDGSISVRDIGSANGVQLNGRALAPMVDEPLHDGDRLTLGRWTRITIQSA
jgi:hypothetical protein